MGAAGFTLACASASGQIVAPATGPRPFVDFERPEDRVSLALYGLGRAAFDADLDDGGSVAVHRAGAGADLSIPLSESWRAFVGLGGESSFYDFDAAPGVLPGTDDPFDDLHRLGVDLGVSQRVSQRWSWAVTGRVEWAAQSGADVDESLLGAGFARARYAFNERFGLSFGLLGQTRLESDARVFPIVGFDWRVSDNLAIYTEGPGLTIAAKLSEEWVLSAKGRWETREYRLDDDGLLPGGVLEDERVLIGAEIAWRPNKTVEAALEVGGVVHQDFDALNGRGVTIESDQTDPALFIGGRLILRF